MKKFKYTVMVKDPVCGMEIERGELKEPHNGKVYYFCSEACHSIFKSNPRHFIK